MPHHSKQDVARSKSRTLYQLETSKGVTPLVSTPIRCRHSDTWYGDHSIQIGRPSMTIGKPGLKKRPTRKALFVSHGEDAIPAGRRLIEEIFLTALPVELMGLLEEIEASTYFVRGAVNRVFGGAADEFVDGNRLELAFYADEIEFAKDETVILGCGIRGFVDQDVRAVIFIQPFQARGEIHGVAEGGVAVAERGAHVADAGHAGVQPNANVEMRLAFGFPFLLHLADALHHFQYGITGSGRVAGFFKGRAPEGHHRVADVLVESAMVLENQAGHVRKILVQEIREILSVQFCGNGREAANIAEHHGNVGFLWFYKTRIDEQAADDFGA